MAETEHIGARGEHWSISTFAAETGRTRETITKRINNAKLVPMGGTDAVDRDGKQRGALWRVREVLPLLYETGDDGLFDPEKLQPSVRDAWYRGEKVRRELEIDARNLFVGEEVEEELSEVFKLCAQAFDTLPDLLERDAGLKPEAITLVERICDTMRNDLADRIAKRPPRQPTPSAAASVADLF